MGWMYYGLLAAIAGFTLFVWGHGVGYVQGHEDGERFQARQNTPFPMPGMSTAGAASDAMSEPTTEAQPALSWIDRLEQEINGK